MSLSIGRALQEGIVRTISRNGLLLAVITGVSSALSLLAYNSVLEAVVPDTAGQSAATIGPALPISLPLAAVATVVLYLVSFVVVVATLRTFVTDETRTVPGEYFTRNLGWVLVNYVVGYIVFLVAVWIGLILLVVPGIFLLVSLFFWYVLVAVEDQNFVEAFRNSWALTRGNRWPLLGLGLIVMVVGAFVYGVLFLAAFVTSPWPTLAIYAVVGAVFAVFINATAARAYVQLAEDETGDGSAAA